MPALEVILVLGRLSSASHVQYAPGPTDHGA